MNDSRIVIEDKVYRALGLLSKAKMISSMECLELISALRLGVELKILQSIERKTLNHLMVITQPAHIQKQRKKKLSEIERDSVRAELIKEKLHLN